MMTDDTPLSYGTPQDPRPTVAQVLAAIDAAVAYWADLPEPEARTFHERLAEAA